MSTPSRESTSTQRQRRGPRYTTAETAQSDPSESMRIFKEETDGLTGRLPLANIHGMRAGLVNNPYTLARRYLVAMRSVGLPKEKAVRFALWVMRQTDALWPMEATERTVLQQREMRREADHDFAEKCLDLARTPETVRACLDTCNAEIAAQMLVAAKLERELEELESGK